MIISMKSTVLVEEQQISAPLGNETVMLHTEDGVYYGLDPVGTSIWNLLQQPRTVGEIRDGILAEYDVEPERCEADLIGLLEQLATSRLVRISDPRSIAP